MSLKKKSEKICIIEAEIGLMFALTLILKMWNHSVNHVSFVPLACFIHVCYNLKQAECKTLVRAQVFSCLCGLIFELPLRLISHFSSLVLIMSLWGEQHLCSTNWTPLLGFCLTIRATHIHTVTLAHSWIYTKKKKKPPKHIQPTCGVHLFGSKHLERDPCSRLVLRKRCKIIDSYFFKQTLESFCSHSYKISKENVKRQKFFSAVWDLYLILQMLKFAFSTEY